MKSLVPLSIPPAAEDDHAVRLDQLGTTGSPGPQRYVVLHDFGSGSEPVTDADGLWLYGAYDMELEH
jgi:hypothetical protein